MLSYYLQCVKLVLGVKAWKRHGDELLARPADCQAVLACLLRQVLPVLAARMEAAAARGISWESVQPHEATIAVSGLWQGDEPGMGRPGPRLPPGGPDEWLGGLMGAADTRLFYELHLVSGYVTILQAGRQLDYQLAMAAIPVLARIAAALPSPRPPVMPFRSFAALHGSLACLLALSCTALRMAAGEQLQRQPTAGTTAGLSSFAGQQLSIAAWVAVGLIPYMASTLRAVAADLPATAGRLVDLSAWYGRALLLLSPASSMPTFSICSWEQLAAWAAAADAGLRQLPLLAGSSTALRERSPSTNLGTPILAWLCCVGAALALEWCNEKCPPPQASFEALACQLWQLHSSAARLVHLLAGSSPLAREIQGGWPLVSCELLHYTFAAAGALLTDVGWQSRCAVLRC